MKKNRHVRFQYARATEFGLHRQTVYKAFEQLQGAGLVEVDRGRGRCPVVTILDAPSEK
jgi:DNA-binding transcriptional regulator YhcF (GntR family)